MNIRLKQTNDKQLILMSSMLEIMVGVLGGVVQDFESKDIY